MKRVLTFLAILLLPLSLWAMTPVSDSDLSNVTGQAGVSINADLSMDISIGTMAWGDDNGVKDYFSGSSIGGFVGVQNFNLTGLRVRARTETSDHWNSYTTMFLKPITIDVATAPAGSAYESIAGHSGVTFVRIGLGALQISVNSMALNVGTGAYVPVGSDVAINQIMGSINLGNMQVYINPMAYVDIFARTGATNTGQGVVFALGVILDRIELGYVSWGDSDGFDTAYTTNTFGWNTAGTDAGYVGLNGLTLGDANDWAVKIAGTVAIDVFTIPAGQDVYSYLPAAIAGGKAWYVTSQLAGVAPTAGSPEYTRLMTFLASNGATDGVTAFGYDIVANIKANPAASVWAPYGGVANATSVVHITFPGTLTVNVGAIRSQVCLSGVPQLTAGPGTGVMGDIYLQSFNVNIFQNSWVDIWAH